MMVQHRRALFAAASAVILSGGVSASAAASVADMVEQPDAELIAACGRFCELERDFDAVCLSDANGGASAQAKHIAIVSDMLVERMIAMPCTTLAGVQAMARALAAWDRELLTDAPAQDVGELITSHLVERLLALPSEGV